MWVYNRIDLDAGIFFRNQGDSEDEEPARFKGAVVDLVKFRD